jgi:two-component system OmpR family response regulator
LRILLLEDDHDAAERVRAALKSWEGAEIDHVTEGEEALRRAAGTPFDILILDRMVEGMDGLQALERLRANDIRTPALVLSNLGATRNRIEGLDAGADDYLAKPFDGEELVARLRALLRRASAEANPDALILGPLDLRLKARTVHWRGRHVDLSPKEFDILKFLAENHDVVVSREMIWNAAWPEYRIPPQINVIDVNLSRLRGKLDAAAGRSLVETVRKQGFVLRSALGPA